MRFVDEAAITVRSGKGGAGCIAFRRERFIPKGGPSGGDGGRGGSVFLRASDKLLTLYDFRLKRVYEARGGQPGMGNERYGKAADDLIIDLPVGTLVYEVHADGSETLITDLTEIGTTVLICKGGDGGRGNVHFKSATRRAPRIAEPGWPNEEKRLRLELKILADVGLLGLPNAGKSTFISAISAARPKIAAYPFTTLEPNLGVLADDFERRMVIADIPGLIEGASEGLGLGHTFLKHVERTRFLVHILSLEDVDKEYPFAGFELLDEELSKFNDELGRKTQIRVFNKIDVADPETLEAIKARAAELDEPIFFISALHGQGLDELVKEMWTRLRELDIPPEPKNAQDFMDEEPDGLEDDQD